MQYVGVLCRCNDFGLLKGDELKESLEGGMRVHEMMYDTRRVQCIISIWGNVARRNGGDIQVRDGGAMRVQRGTSDDKREALRDSEGKNANDRR